MIIELMNSLNVLVIFTIIGMMIVGTSSLSTTAFAEPKNGWGKATSERATEQGDIGEHSKAGGAAGEPPFDDDETPGRQGIGNVGDTDDNNLHPNDLGNFLDCADENVDEGEGGSIENCS
jgi:hypothetical protein